jgi:hypothetical protein
MAKLGVSFLDGNILKEIRSKRKRRSHIKVRLNVYYAYVKSYLIENTACIHYKNQSVNAVTEINSSNPPPPHCTKYVNKLRGESKDL